MEKHIEDLFASGNDAYENGNYAQSAAFYKQAADCGHPEAARYLAWQFYKGLGVESDWTKANAYWLVAAEAGSVRGQTNLGLSHLDGLGVEKNVQRGIALLERAYAGGDMFAAAHLGRLYLKGSDGVTMDQEKGLAFLNEAVKAGETLAYHLLIEFYIEVKHDKENAMRLVKELKSIGGCLKGKESVFLALELLISNESTDEEKREAIKLLKHAMNYENSPTAALIIGLCYNAGFVLPNDPEMAIRFYRVSAQCGSNVAKRILKDEAEKVVELARTGECND